MSEEQKTKEEMVQKEIIDKGYDLDDFQSFIKRTIQCDNIDFNSWTLSEIADSIRDYQESQSRFLNQQNPQIMDKININQIQNNSEQDIDSDSSEEFIKSKLQEPSTLTNCQNVVIRISKSEKYSNGLFSFTNILFTIECKSLNSRIQRTFTDFQWLKKKLDIFYPNIYVPPLPDVSFFHKFTDGYLNKKGRYLSKFLNSVVQNIVLRSSEMVIDFLSLDQEEFAKRVEEFNKLNPPENIKKYKTINKKIKISASNEKELQADRIKNIINLRSQAYINLNNEIKSLFYCFDELCDRIMNVSKALKKFQKLYSGNMKDVFCGLENMTNNYCDTFRNQKLFIKTYFQESFKYIQKYNMDFVKFYDNYQDSKYKFVCEYIKYDSYKNLKEKDQKIINKLRKVYGFNLNRLIDEFNNLDGTMTYQGIKQQIELLLEKKEVLSNGYSKIFKEMSNLFGIKIEENKVEEINII